jgi:hypothetical protein
VYWLNLAIGFDQLLNVVFHGQPDETLSARAHRKHLDGRSGWRNAINWIFFWQADHCLGAYLEEVRRHQYPTHYQTGGV